MSWNVLKLIYIVMKFSINNNNYEKKNKKKKNILTS